VSAQPSVIVLAPNSFARFIGSAIESQFQLLLRDASLASLHNFDLVFNSPISSPGLDNGFKETNPMAGYYLESFLKLNGYDASTVFDWSDDVALERALESDPIAVALSTTYITDNALLATCIRALRRIVDSLPIIVGGPYVWKQRLELGLNGRGSERANALKEFGVDALAGCLFAESAPFELRRITYIAHEFGERTLLRVLDRIAAGQSGASDLFDIPNLVLATDDGLWHPTKSEAEPVDLDRDYTHWDLIESMPTMVPLRASVGCPHRCRYCDFIELHPRVHMRSPQSIAAEIDLAKGRAGRFFGFIDDNIFLSKKRIAQITDTLLSQELDVIWGGFFRVDRVDETNIDQLKRSGCTFGLCGIESGDDGQLERMRKGCERDEVRRGIELCSQAGIHLNLSMLIGYPGETRESIENSIAFLNGLSTDSASIPSWLAYPFYLLPNTAVDEPEFRRLYNIMGRRSTWRHATMSSDETIETWAPYMFRGVESLPYHYYAGDVPRWWEVAKRNRAIALRKDLTSVFMDDRDDVAVQNSFASLYACIADGGERAAAPPWSEVLAERRVQPGQRGSYRGAFEC
jgi:p-methyltransferase